MCQNLLTQQVASIPQESLSTAGKDVCYNYWLHSGINLQQLKIQAFRRSLLYNNLDPPSIEELTWWSTQLQLWNARDIRPHIPEMMIDTDAPLTGCMGSSLQWCVHRRTVVPRGKETSHQSPGAFSGLFCSTFLQFTKDKKDIHVHPWVDNNTGRFYVRGPANQLDGTSPLPMTSGVYRGP